VQKRVSFRGATFGAYGQQGMRTFRGPEEDVDGDVLVRPAPDAQEEVPAPLARPPPRSMPARTSTYEPHDRRHVGMHTGGHKAFICSLARAYRSQPLTRRLAYTSASSKSSTHHWQPGLHNVRLGATQPAR